MSPTTAFAPVTVIASPEEANYILFDSFMDSSSGTTRLEFRILNNQPGFEKQLSVPLELLKMTLDKAAVIRRPCGTVMICDDYTFTDEDTVHINSFTPMILEGSPLPVMTGMTEALEHKIDYLVKFLYNSQNAEYGEDFAKTIADQYSAWGYDVDWAKLLAEPAAPVVEETEEFETPVGSYLQELLNQYPCPPKEKYNFKIHPKVWAILLRNRFRKKNTLLTGPTGCGKTEILDILAKELGEELFIQDMGTVQDVQSSLIGVHRLDKDHKSIFDPAPFVHYIQSGHLVLMDEINRAPVSAQNVTFPSLDGRRYLPLDIAAEGEERHIKLHEETWMCGTANLGAEYGGTQSIDRAFKDRFHILELTYMDFEDEVEILILRTGIERKLAETIVKLAQLTREEYRSQGLSEAVSTRHTIATAEYVADGFDLNDSIESVIFPLFENDGDDSERSKIIGMMTQF